MKHEREQGIAMVLAALFLTAIIAIFAIALEISRLTDTATEVQVAADAAALAGAQNITSGGTTGTAQDAGQRVAGKNTADGRSPAPSDVQIEFGKYTPGIGFVAGAADNAVRATVTMQNVRYILASVFGGPSTSVTKRAVAAYKCNNCATPAPITICDCALTSTSPGEPCTAITGGSLIQAPNGAQNSCLLSTAGQSADEAWFPSDCFATGGTGPLISSGDTITLDNGQLTPVINDFESCVNDGVTDYVIPVVQCSDFGTCNGGKCTNHPADTCITNADCCHIGQCNHTGTVIGFATMHVTMVNAHGSPKTVSLTQVCNNAAPGGPCASGTAQCFGSGSVKLVADLPSG
jgi:hypothetical protein